MPIKNLTDHSVAARFERIGKLRKGGPKRKNQQGKEIMGVELEYFRFTSDNPAVLAAFRDAYGDKPALIRVILPYAQADENFPSWREKWVAGGLEHRCDGETQVLWRRPDGQMSHEPRPCDGLECKPVGRLNVIVPELLEQGFVGYVTVETHSLNDLVSMTAGLHAAEEITRGRTLGLRGVYCILRRVKTKISTPGQNGKRASREKWLISLSPDAGWVKVQLKLTHEQQMDLLQLAAPVVALPDGRRVDRATGEISGVDDNLDDPFEHVDAEDEDEPVDTTAAEVPSADGRPWGRDRVLALLRDYVKTAGQAGEVPPTDDDAHLAKKLVQGLIGVEGARKFLQVAFRNNDWGGISQAKADAISKIWVTVDRQGGLNVSDATVLAEAQAVIGGADASGK